MTIKQDIKDISDLRELYNDSQSGKFNTRTTELLGKALTHYRAAILQRHVDEMAKLDMIRSICARELGMPKDSKFFSMTYEEDYRPLGWSHDDFLLHIFEEEKAAQDYDTDIDVILALYHG